MLIIAFCVALCVYLLIYAPAWWRRRLLSNIPKLPGDKLSKDALLAVGRSLGALGPLVRLPGEHGVLVTDPSLAKRLLEHGGGAVVREMTAYERYGGFLGGSLVLLPQATPAHRTLRSALLPLFSVAATRRAHGALLECTQRLLDAISTKSAAIGSDRAIPLYRLLQNFVIDVTSTSFLSHRLGDAESRRLIALLEEWLDTPPPLPPTTMQRLWRRFGRGGPIEVDRLHRAYDVLLDKLCAKQADAFTVADNTSHPTSVYAALNACGLATDDEVRNQTAGLLFAGLNSAKELHFMLSLLAKHPKLQEEARMEVDQKLGASLPTYESLSKGLDLCSRIVHEALRLSPGIEHLRLITTRTMRTPAAAGSNAGALLPSGTRLVVSPSLLHKHPTHYPQQPNDQPQPELFTDSAQAARPAGSFLPFSAGAKGCPAGGFALHEMRMLLVRVLQVFELREDAAGKGVCCIVRSREEEQEAAEAEPPP